MKKRCAKEALKMISDGMTVGLGGGSTISFLIEEVKNAGKQIQAVTPSMNTEELCRKSGIVVLPLSQVEEIDVAFDGCDEVDWEFNALKSCGGIHTREKLVADMSQKYFLLADEAKYHEELKFEYPVTVEVLPSARSYVKRQLSLLGAQVRERMCDNKTGLTITDDGNYLMEARFIERQNAASLNDTLNAMTGIIGHGLFYKKATGVIVAGKDRIDIFQK